MRERGILSQFDYFLFLAVLLLAFLGVLGIHNAGSSALENGIFLRQLVWIGLGVGVCLVIMSIDYHFLVDHAFLFYFLAIALLVGILFFGTEINSSRSWFTIGDLSFQPSEIAKIALILILARYLDGMSENFLKPKQVFILAFVTFLPIILIVAQGDLGTAIMYLPIFVGITIVAGLKGRLFFGLVALLLSLIPFGWLVLEDYQKQRILVTLDPELDPQGVGYQTRQSQIAIGSGGVFGKGLGQGLQSQLGFVPEIRTDFIFALLAEETGLVGAAVILMLYLFVLMRLLRIAELARDRVGILIVTGIASFTFGHVAVNIGMTLGVLPPIGIPLPLLSYGGSSTVTTFAALGLALNVYQRRFVH